jgi:uncharacterized membrane protein
MNEFNAKSVWESLSGANLVEGDMPTLTDNVTPWYVRVMLGAGGFIGALFLLGFVGAGFYFIMKSGGLSVFFGVTMCVVSTVIYSKKSSSDFASQFAFTLSLAGQVLLIFGLSKLLPSSGRIVASLVFVIQCSLFILISSFQHRVFSAVIGLYALIYIFNSYGLYLYMHIILFAVCAAIWLQEFKYPKHASYLRALGYGSAVLLFYNLIGGGGLWLVMSVLRGDDVSSLFLSSEWTVWLRQSLIGIVMLASVITLLKRHGIPDTSKDMRLIVFATVTFLLITVKLPAISIIITLLIISFAHGNQVLLGLSGIALIIFMSRYYYFLNVTLLEKSAILILAGFVLLALRYGIRFIWPDDNKEVEHHA